MSKVIFEIFSEEIPATLQKKIAIDYRQFIEMFLKKTAVSFKNEDLHICITLNRLVLIINNCNINDETLFSLIDSVLKEFSKFFPRTMCYPQLQVRWLRPIRNIFACIDDRVLSGNFSGLNLTNGTYTQKFDFNICHSCDDYEKVLKNEEIEIDFNKRFEFVNGEVLKHNKNYKNNKLIEEIAGMSEYCIAPMKCLLDSKFNILPFELIELVLRENQRYVVFEPNENGEIYFLIFGDKITKNDEKRQNIINGHKKVVNARLEDALYYWNLDDKIKKDVEYLKDILSNRTFIDDISWKEYLNSQIELCHELSNSLNNCFNQQVVDKLIYETKIDLATGVVAEFPELQGIIGSYYFGYGFNPYTVDVEKLKQNQTDALFYYFIDRLSYIQTMYKLGKQPTGSGDKFKVKARIDDILNVLEVFEKYYDFPNENIKKMLSFLKLNDDIYKIFIKRYQKHIEDCFCDFAKIKKFCEVCSTLLMNKDFKMFDDIEEKIKLIDNKEFITTYKRIIGYTDNIEYDEEKNILKKVDELLPSKENIYYNINSYLDNNKIADDILVRKALKYIEVNYFNAKLEHEFLAIV